MTKPPNQTFYCIGSFTESRELEIVKYMPLKNTVRIRIGKTTNSVLCELTVNLKKMSFDNIIKEQGATCSDASRDSTCRVFLNSYENVQEVILLLKVSSSYRSVSKSFPNPSGNSRRQS